MSPWDQEDLFCLALVVIAFAATVIAILNPNAI